MIYEEAREYTKPFNLSTFKEFTQWSSSGQRSSNFPVNPRQKYKEDWIDWKHFLGVED